MFPFGAYTGTPEPKRTINLGGASASTTSLTPDAIFSSVQAARNARQEHKARTSAAIEVQRWWRGEKERRRVKEGLLTLFLESVGSDEGMDVDAGSATGRDEMTALRCLVLIGSGKAGEQALEMWAGQVLRRTGTRGVDTLWRPDDTSRPILASTRDSYEVLIRQTAVLLLESVARDPISSRSASFLTILRALHFPGDDTTPSQPSPASPSTSKSVPRKPVAKSGASAAAASVTKISERAQACARLTRYLLSKGLYDLLAQAIKGVPATAVAGDSPTAHAASALIELSVLPLTTFAPSTPSSANLAPNSMLVDSESSSPNIYLSALTQLVTRILSIPLLPNRLPLAALPRLVGALPLQKFDVLAPRVDVILADSASFSPPGPSATFAPVKVGSHNPTGACPSETRGTTAEDKLHLLANLHLFASPHYKLMTATAMETYLRLTAGLLDRLPGGVLTKKVASEKSKTAKGKEKEKGANSAKGLGGDKGKGKHVTKKQRLLGSAANESASNSNSAYSSMDESDSRPAPTTRVVVVDSFDTDPSVAAKRAKEENIIVDAKTAARLSKLASQAHLSALTGAAGGKRGVFPALVGYLFSLTTAFGSSPASASGGVTSSHAPDGVERAERDRATGPAAEAEKSILNHLLASTGGGLVREVYRDLVRRGTLGKEDASGPVYAGRGANGSIMDQANASQWPALLFLADLYSQALLTMGDDEFFGVAGSASAVGSAFSSASANVNPNNTARVARNPLTLDELTEFSRQLLNIAFALYYREDSNGGGVGSVMQQDVVEGMRCTWEAAREKVTRCLVGIHARDSRKPFVPVDHWLATAHLDMHSFVEAAVLEEQQLSNADSNNDEHLAISLPTRGPRRSYNNRQLSKRQIAAMSPRLGVLNNIPFAIPFEVRVSIFRHFVMNDMMARSGSTDSFGRRFGGPWGMGGKARVQVRRGMVAQDGFDRLGEVDLKAPIEITFIDQFGQEEAGIDGGGVFKEFFTSLCQEVFDTDRGLWLANKKNELYPNPHAYATEAHSLNWYRFIGRILGKAMYEGILVDVAFAGFFLAKWLGRQSFLDDLSSLDPDLYNGLIFLKHFTGNVEDLSLNFAMAVDEFGVTKSVDLIPNGSNIAVTKENRLQYIYCVSHYRLSKQIKAQSAAFFEGLSEMIDQKWLRMFNQQEVQILIGGVNAPIDLDDLRKHTNYGGLYDDGHEVVRMFWSVVNDFDQEQRRALLRFVTSCSRPPLLGFKELVPNFSIRDAGADQYRLPTSSTCVNLLKLPRYNNPTTLRQKLLQAINSNAGFDLS